PGMRVLGRLVDLLGFEHAVRREKTLDGDDTDDFAALVGEGELLALTDLAPSRRGHRQRDGNGKEDAVREPAAANDGEVVFFAEEAFERRERARRDELRVGRRARVERD